MTTAEIDAEQAFCELCRSWNATTIGVWHGEPVNYTLPLLFPPTTPSLADRMVAHEQAKARLLAKKNAKSEGQCVSVDPTRVAHAREAGGQADTRIAEYHLQALGYAGWLMADPQFSGELCGLRKQWVALGRPEVFPLRATVMARPEGAVLNPTFDKSVHAFLRRWQLEELVTWDLPSPQLPTILPASVAGRLLGTHVVICLPTFFDIQSSKAFHDYVIEQQRTLATSLGIEQEHPRTDIAAKRAKTSHRVAGGPSRWLPSTWATQFRLEFVERNARSRYDQRRGLTDRLERRMIAFLAALGQTIAIQRVQQLRGGYLDKTRTRTPSQHT